MKNPVKRLICTIIVAIAFLLVYAGVMYIFERPRYENLIVRHNHAQTESVGSLFEQFEKTDREIGEVLGNEMDTLVRLRTLALSSAAQNGQYDGSRRRKLKNT